MKRVMGLALAFVVVLAAPAAAHVAVVPERTAAAQEAPLTHAEAGESESAATDDGADGTDFGTFLALAIGGVALMAAVAALIMGPKRIPA